MRQALSAVVEPELGRPITELGFVAGVSIDADRVHVRLRAPSFFRLQRHGWLVLADARAAIAVLPWAETVDLCFAGAAAGVGPPVPHDVPPSEEEKAAIRRAAYLDRHLHLIRSLLDRGLRREEIRVLTLADLPPSAASAVYLKRRAEALLPIDPGSPVMVTDDGLPVHAADVDEYLARLRSTSASD